MGDNYKQVREQNEKLFSRWYTIHCEVLDELTHKKIKFNRKMSIENIQDKLSSDYLCGILRSFSELVDIYTYSVAANRLSKELEESGEDGMASFWKYNIRNVWFRNFIPRYFSTSDYLAFMIYELSKGELFPEFTDDEPRGISFYKMKEKLSESLNENCDIGWLSFNDRKKILELFQSAFDNINPKGKNALRRYRNIITHRYLPGIDEMIISTVREGTNTRAIGRGKLMSIGNGENTWVIFGGPEFNFKELISVSKVLLDNMNSIIYGLANLNVMDRVISKSE